MASKWLMGLDAGGGGGRCLLVHAGTGEAVGAYRPWTLPPAPEIGGFAFTLDPSGVWRTLGEAAREVLRVAGARPQDVVGIAATSMRHSTIVIDGDGRVLLAAPNRDARAAEQGMQLAAERGEELHRITGHAPSPIFMAARLIWMRDCQPQAFQSATAALSFSDWIGYLLTGKPASERSQAGESLLLDLKTRRWSGEILRTLGLPEKLLPPLMDAGERLGPLSAAAAANLGLAAGIPVAVGGPDTQCGLLGSGAIAAGQMAAVAGTTTPVQQVLDQAVVDPGMRLWTGLHVIPGLYVLESNAGQMGSTLEWVARLIHPQALDPVAMLAAEADASDAGAHGVLSAIGASVFNAGAMEPPVDSLTFSAVAARPGDEGRSDVARAVLEGMACAVRANVEQIVQVSGRPVQDLRLSGGLTRSELWTQVVSDVMGCGVQVAACVEASAMGAAICAGVAAGEFPDLATGSSRLARTARRHLPGSEAPAYQGLYAAWSSLLRERRPADLIAVGRFTEAMMAGLADGEASRRPPTAFRPRIYIAAEVDEAGLGRLGELGEVTYKPYRREGILLAGDHLVQSLRGYQVFVTEVDVVDAEAVLQLPDLRLIVACRGNPVNVDIEACSLAGIPVVNTPARNADAVADLAVAFMLMLARKLQPGTSFLRQPGGEAGDLGRMGQAHEEFLGSELWHKTVGLVGGGAIGSKVIQRLLPFGARVLLYDPYLTSGQAARLGAEKVPLETLLERSDFVSLHAPVADDTRRMIDGRALGRMKAGSFLVNTARAALVEEQAVLEALRSGRLGGFATDVFPVEPPAADDPLLSLPNVIATPHIGGNTREVAAHQGEIIADELHALLSGGEPRHILNAATLASFSWSAERVSDPRALRERMAEPGPGTTDLEVSARRGSSAAERTAEAGTVEVPESGSVTDGGQDAPAQAAREKMAAILTEFTRALAGEREMARFAKGKNVVFEFTVRDLDLAFFLSFVDGVVTTGLGGPPRQPDVRLKMSADVLDGMFTGRINATKAATTGKLSFSGDTAKAMSFIRIQGAMGRLYAAARAKAGDPGDLTSLTAVAAPASLAPPPVAPVAAAAASVGEAGIDAARERMRRILHEFTSAIAADAGMASFAKGKNVVFSFMLKDMDLAFFLSFVDGRVDAGLQAPPREPDVRLKMAAEILDGMFTERINATKAATTGKLSFSGDTGKAMAFMRIQKDMGRLYVQARAQAGDPGDLTQLGSPPATPASAVPGSAPSAGTTAAPAPTGAPAVRKTGDVRDQILQVTSELYAKGLITPTGGNVSARCEDNPDHVWITPSAIFKGDLRPEMMVRIDLDGRIVGDTDFSASSERRVHCAIYRSMPEIQAVIHSHAPQATVMAITGTPFLPISTEAAFIGDIPIVPFILPGTDELGESVARAMQANGIAVLMQNHGLVVAGSSLRRAADMTDVVEVTSHKLLSCKALGVEPSVLPEETVRTLKELGASMA